jgi:hypothetical protein
MATPKLTLGDVCWVLRHPASGQYISRRGVLSAEPEKAQRFVNEEAALQEITRAAEAGSDIPLEPEKWEVVITTHAQVAP